MKTLILSIAIVFSTLTSFSQTLIDSLEKAKIEEFILDRSFAMNKVKKPILVKDAATLIKKYNEFAKHHINVSYNSFIFIGNQVNDKSYIGGEGKSFCGGKVKPFSYYSIKKEKGRTILELVDGNSSL
jgi:hypothetical protein